MKKSTFFSFVFILILLLMSMITAYGQKTFTARTSAEGLKIVNVKGFSKAEVFSTKGSQIRFEVTVSLETEGGSNLPSNRKDALIKYLANTGRYQLEMIDDHALETLEVNPPKNTDVLISKSYGNIREDISVKVFVPEGIMLKVEE